MAKALAVMPVAVAVMAVALAREILPTAMEIVGGTSVAIPPDPEPGFPLALIVKVLAATPPTVHVAL